MQAESRWAALCTRRGGGERVKIERASKRNGYGWGGGRKERGKNYPENGRRKGWGGRAILKSSNKRQILGPEWSMSKVGNPPPHNSDKPHGLVDSINNIHHIIFFHTTNITAWNSINTLHRQKRNPHPRNPTFLFLLVQLP